MKRPVYDISMKLNVVEEYRRGGITYNGLARKHNIPRATIASWILKLKNHDCSLIMRNEQPSTFINVTKQVNPMIREPSNDQENEIILSINGFSIKGDISTITRLLTGDR
ncbi:MAG: transposase [Bacilli bacterium]|nr:transposase [Bacilli bacterium]